MAFRVVLIENEMSLKVNLDNLVCSKDEGDVRIPLSDISVIVIDNLKINISVRLLNQLAGSNIAVVVCDLEHLPIGLYCSYDNHSRMSKKIKYQVERTAEFYDELWSKIVKTKLANQASVISLLGKDNGVSEAILFFASEVQAGDVTNREAHGAKVYFNELMGATFSRGNEDILYNSGLDYGYSIIRSFIARLCVAYGLNTQLGIHHKNEYNRFNLVDDLLEPVRPILDFFVYKLLDGESFFTAEHRHALINFLNHQIIYNNKKMFISSMLETYISSASAFIEGTRTEVEYPDAMNYLGESDNEHEV